MQQRIFALLPGTKVSAHLRVERITEQGRPICHFYRFVFLNYGPIDYVYAKLQFSEAITSAKVGKLSETMFDENNGGGDLYWEKGYNAKGECAVLKNTLVEDPDISNAVGDHMIDINSLSKLPAGTEIIGLIATTGTGSGFVNHPKLWTEGAYEFSEFGQSIRRKISIKVRFMYKN